MSRPVLTMLLGIGILAQAGCAIEILDEQPEHEDEIELEIGQAHQSLYPKVVSLWPQDTAIPTCWENPDDGDPLARGWVQDAVARSWETASNTRFTGWGTCNANSRGIRIRIEDVPDAVHVKKLGRENDGLRDGMSLNFTFKRWNVFCGLSSERERCVRGLAVHEFGHALGFSHEQNRPDNPENCTAQKLGTPGDTLYGPWDLSSTMNYCNPVYNNDGVLSGADAAGARALYGTRKIANFGYQQGSWQSSRHVRMVADVDGDLRDDIVGFGDAGVIVSLARAAGGFDPPRLFIGDFGSNQGWRVDQHVRTLADVNGDRRADIVAFGNDGVWLALSGGVRFYEPVFLGDFGYNQGWRVDRHVRTLADVNADGRADIVGFGDAGVWVSYSLTAQFAAPQFLIADFGYESGWRVADHVRTLADINDDDRADVVGFGTYGVMVSLANGNGFAAPQLFTSEFGFNAGYRVGFHPRMLADVNRDGRADVVAFGRDGVRVALSGSVTFYPSQLVLADMGYDSGWRVDKHPRFVRDVNGDGRPDLVGFGDAGVYVATSLGGSAFGPMDLWAIRYSAADAVLANGNPLPIAENVRGLGDFDGDGSGDVFAFRANGLHTTDLSFHLGRQP